MKHFIWSSIIVLAMCLTACFDDDSSLGNPNYNDIEIILPEDMSIMSFMGNVLNITPEINTQYDESTLTYAWYLFLGDEADAENGYKDFQIADTRDLSYEVNLSSGNYTLVFEVTSTTDHLVRSASMQVRTATSFSQGFYILKETADGNTDLDVYGIEGFSEDVLTGIYGVPLSGKPLNLSMTYNQCYIDDETQEMAGANMAHIFTDAGIYRGYRVEDMTELFNNQTIRFDGLDADEIPYSMVRGMWGNFFITNKGCYGNYGWDVESSSGIYGLTADGSTGGSKYVVTLGGGGTGQCFWNNTTHSFNSIDFNFGTVSDMDYDAEGIDESRLECIACGENSFGGIATGCFVCENSNGERYLYTIDLSSGKVTDLQKLDGELHIAQADLMSVNGLTASVIYSVHDNKIYAYSWATNGESEVKLPGFPSDEEIVYLSNQYQKSSMFSVPDPADYNNLIVGTATERGYKLYFYDLSIGTSPIANAESVVEGSGTVRHVRFISPNFALSPMGNMPMFGDPSSCVPYWD